MKWTTIILSFWICLPFFLSAQSQLLRIEESGKFGYINLDGEIVIPPKYPSAFHFSEGLAAVRLTDKFGFIDSTGNWKIPPIYDYAKPFKGGQASVWLRKVEMVVSSTGITSPKPEYKARNSSPKGYSILKSSNRKLGVVNQDGILILDTIYHQISWRSERYYDLYQTKIIDQRNNSYMHDIADSLGHLIIPFEKYKRINSLGDGWFHVIKRDSISDSKINEVIPKEAHGILHIDDLVFRPITDTRFKKITRKLSDGCISAMFWETTNNKTQYYAGYIDTTGQVILADTNVNYTYPFINGFAFISDREKKKTFLIDKKGTRLNKIGISKLLPIFSSNTRFFDRSIDDYFMNGWTIVKTDNGIAKLNKKGEIEIIKELAGMDFGSFLEDRYLLLIPDKTKPKPHYRGVYDVVEERLLPIHYKKIHPKLYGNKVFGVEGKERSGYVDTSGSIVWHQKNPVEIYPYDVDHKVRLRRRKNKPKKLHWMYRLLKSKPKVFVGFRKKTFTENSKKYHANNLYLSNTSKDTLVFDGGMSGRLPLKLQAKDSKGDWQNIIKYPSCAGGISRNAKRELPPGHYWYYRFPKFEGHVKTKFRVVVPYTKKGEPDVPLQMITTFKGGINPAQFLRAGR